MTAVETFIAAVSRHCTVSMVCSSPPIAVRRSRISRTNSSRRSDTRPAARSAARCSPRVAVRAAAYGDRMITLRDGRIIDEVVAPNHQVAHQA
jgi:hypothetical protein